MSNDRKNKVFDYDYSNDKKIIKIYFSNAIPLTKTSSVKITNVTHNDPVHFISLAKTNKKCDEN